MRNPVYLTTLPNGKLLYWADPDFPAGTINIANGTHLLVEESLLESDYPKTVEIPVRPLTPINIISNGNPYFVSVLKEDKFYAWYSAIKNGVYFNGHSVSDDGVNWTYIANLTGTGVYAPVKVGNVYKAIVQNPNGTNPRWPGDLWNSIDRINWTPYVNNPVIPTPYGESYILFQKADGNFGVLHRYNRDYTWVDKQGVTHHPYFIRTFAFTQATSTALSFPPSISVFVPDNQDDGQTEFYTVSNIIYRGGIYLGSLSVYREDTIATGAPTGVNGTGYSSIIWSTDGVNWVRSRDKFFSPSADNTAFDHAITWISSIVSMGDEDWLYYAGYQWGHVTPLRDDRHLGLLKIKKNRFFSRTGTIRTKLINFNAQKMTLNLNGTAIVRFLDENNYPILPDYSINGNSVSLPIGIDLLILANRAIKIEFIVTGKLFGFDLQ